MCPFATGSPELPAGTLNKYLTTSPTLSLSLTLYFVWKFQDLRQEARSFRARVGHAQRDLSQNQGPLCRAQAQVGQGPGFLAVCSPVRHTCLPEGWWDWSHSWKNAHAGS